MQFPEHGGKHFQVQGNIIRQQNMPLGDLHRLEPFQFSGDTFRRISDIRDMLQLQRKDTSFSKLAPQENSSPHPFRQPL